MSNQKPKRLTRNIICDRVAEVTGVKREYIELVKNAESDGGDHSWIGKAGSCFRTTQTHIRLLNDVRLDWWVDSFVGELEDWDWNHNTEKGRDVKVIGAAFNAYIESIDWNVEYEND